MFAIDCRMGMHGLGISASLQDNISFAATLLSNEENSYIRDAKARLLIYCQYAFSLTLRRVSGKARQLVKVVEKYPLGEEEMRLLQTFPKQAHNMIWVWMIAIWNDLHSRNLLPGGDESLRSVVHSCNTGRCDELTEM